jgi:nucleoside-diphosphate-sugar epimerase
MKIMVTGGLGHIGSRLIESIGEQHEVVVVDDLLTQRYCSLFNLGRKIKFLEKSISDLREEDMEGVDVVIHLAAVTNAAGSFSNKEELEKINLEYTSEFIDLCEKKGCKFIFPSSTSVYGTAAETVDESKEEYLNPQSPYAETKIAIENKLKSYKGDHIVLRFGTIFGKSKGMRFHTAINKFCYEASMGIPLTIWEDNFNQYRPYLGINDAIKALNFCLDREDLWGETYNVLTGNYKLSQIVSFIESIQPVRLNMVKTPLLNQYSYHVSDDKIRSRGFFPEDKIEDCIKETLHLLNNVNNQ